MGCFWGVGDWDSTSVAALAKADEPESEKDADELLKDIADERKAKLTAICRSAPKQIPRSKIPVAKYTLPPKWTQRLWRFVDQDNIDRLNSEVFNHTTDFDIDTLGRSFTKKNQQEGMKLGLIEYEKSENQNPTMVPSLRQFVYVLEVLN